MMTFMPRLRTVLLVIRSAGHKAAVIAFAAVMLAVAIAVSIDGEKLDPQTAALLCGSTGYMAARLWGCERGVSIDQAFVWSVVGGTTSAFVRPNISEAFALLIAYAGTAAAMAMILRIPAGTQPIPPAPPVAPAPLNPAPTDLSTSHPRVLLGLGILIGLLLRRI